MNNEPIELKPAESVNDATDLVLDTDEVIQLAKFLDALLEVDIANRDNGGKVND